MSWLYTIFIAGMLFSSGTDHGTDRTRPKQQTDNVEVSQQVTERFEQTYPLTSNGKVSLSNVNGSIVIEAWDKNEVYVEATKVADTKENLDLVNIEINARPDSIRIEAKYKSWDEWGVKDKYQHRKLEVQFRLMVPRKAILNEINSVNGSVVASNFANFTKISTVNGTLVASNLRGTVKLSTVNGHLRASCERLDAESALYLDTVNGKVNLELPSNVQATLKAETMNGSITNDFGLPVRKGKYVGRDLYGRIGSGDVQVKLSAVNGPLLVSRKKDGRNPSPVTNLLNMNSDDGDDEDSDENEEYGAAAAAIAETTRKSTKAVEKGLKETHKSIEKMKMPDVKDVEVNVGALNETIKNSVNTAMAQQAQSLPRSMDSPGFPGPTSVDQRSRSFDVKGAPKVTVEAPMCNIRVRGWDQPTVKYVLTDARTNREIPISINENASENTVSIKLSNGRRRPAAIFEDESIDRLEVYVPRKSDVRVTSGKEIRVESVAGNIDINGEDDSVSVRDSEGTLRLSNGDGLIRVIGFKGDLELKAGDAEVYLEGDFNKIDSCAVDARITLTMSQNKNASISTNTAIESEGLNLVREDDHTWRIGNGGPKYNFDFASGRLVLRNQARIETN